MESYSQGKPYKTHTVQELPFPRAHVYKHEQWKKTEMTSMSDTVTAVHILQGCMQINYALIKLGSHTRGSSAPHYSCTEQNHHFREITCMPSHSTVSLHKSATAVRTEQGHFLLQDKTHWTVPWWWEKGCGFFCLMTGCFCSTALTQRKNTQRSTIVSVQIYKGINRCSAF